ncbi:hypothetical protein SFOMI_3146 [Sphingobium fuliginis]|jgi:hypothetical protein|uniref:Uncharacterized protein n=1 Tax=Sphingobium fuliginis (strain ATCC 27551) TaxID=336203 RepID=A0A292ZHM5_SPHSA|nr:hypothetical protein SFOMI_3146 [Sphingobium fuliginis]GFZ84716.1 hypothetical protein GCM10019071_11910 [Sphingobium fuliginis]
MTSPSLVIPARSFATSARSSVIPAPSPVIPAKAGTHLPPHPKTQGRGIDGIGRKVNPK